MAFLIFEFEEERKKRRIVRGLVSSYIRTFSVAAVDCDCVVALALVGVLEL